MFDAEIEGAAVAGLGYNAGGAAWVIGDLDVHGEVVGGVELAVRAGTANDEGAVAALVPVGAFDA